ncbi:PDT-domain-containing protein [Schizopora paradoxa]|uniref:prephenate dehydratase n=1 Tax=Schizopora paradoxa TaxID=27342 RepID=A0A0H2RRL8_9AGAM|nr:PDT-domain-containing protein [Schizopora paradoxa]
MNNREEDVDPGAIRHSPAVAFLGPLGTYTHQAAYNRFSTSVTYEAKNSIAGVFESLSSTIPLAVIPKENSIFGSVVETYDQLRSKAVGSTVFIRGEISLAVQHCLLVRKGIRLENVTRVLSHEQALGQCTQFLSEKLPNAKTVKMPSTASAATALFEPEYGSTSAAICSKICVNLFEGLEVLFEGVQNEKSNFTNFWVLATSLDLPLPGTSSTKDSGRAIIRLASLTEAPDVLSTLASLGLFVNRIDRRPYAGDIPFRDIYFVEVSKHADRVVNGIESSSKPIENGEIRWRDVVESAIRRIDSGKWEARMIGIW